MERSEHQRLSEDRVPVFPAAHPQRSAIGAAMHPTAKKTIAVGLLTAPMLGLMILGGAFLLSPSRPAAQPWHLIASLSELPDDGTPLLRPVYGKRFDAWTRLPDEWICDVFVRKEPNTTNVSVVPAWHHGNWRIPLRYDEHENKYVSICWNVAFDLHGKEITTLGMTRIGLDLDELPLKVIDDEIWVCHDATPN